MIKIAGAIVSTVSKNTICKVVATCCGELAESIEILIPGIGDCAYKGIPKQQIANSKKLRRMILILSKQEADCQLAEQETSLKKELISSFIFNAKRGM